ncbi:MAG: NDP-sugar synthase [Thermoplasmata archaeon]|nr:NDP-sugar synthase [Thermoplasmata archaeon]
MLPLTLDTPKWMCGGIATYQLSWLNRHGVNRFVVILNARYRSAGLKNVQVPPYTELKLLYEEEPSGDEGALKKAIDFVRGEEFYAVYCDIITDFDLKKLTSSPSMVVAKPTAPWGVLYGNKLLEKPKLDIWVNAGIFRFSKSLKSRLRDRGVLAEGALREMVEKGEIRIVEHHGFWMNVETIKDLKQVEDMLCSSL